MLTEILPKNHVNTEIPTTSIVGPAKKMCYSKNCTNQGLTVLVLANLFYETKQHYAWTCCNFKKKLFKEIET